MRGVLRGVLIFLTALLLTRLSTHTEVGMAMWSVLPESFWRGLFTMIGIHDANGAESLEVLFVFVVCFGVSIVLFRVASPKSTI